MVSILGRGVTSANFQVEGNLYVSIESVEYSRRDHCWKNWGSPLKHEQKSLFDSIDDGICYAFDLSTIITLGSSYYTCAFYSFINFIMLLACCPAKRWSLPWAMMRPLRRNAVFSKYRHLLQ